MIHQILMLTKGIAKGVALCSGMTVGGYLGATAAEGLGMGKVGSFMLMIGGEIVGTSLSLPSMTMIDDSFEALDKALVKEREEMRKMNLTKEDIDRFTDAARSEQPDVTTIDDPEKGIRYFVSTKTNKVLYTKSIEKE